MLLLFLFVLLLVCLIYFSFLLFVFRLFVCLFFNLCFRGSNLISISTVEFRYYVFIIILVNLGKP